MKKKQWWMTCDINYYIVGHIIISGFKKVDCEDLQPKGHSISSVNNSGKRCVRENEYLMKTMSV